MEHLSQLFKALSEPLRLRIVQRLLPPGTEAYGEELAQSLGIPPYQLSRHLKVLKATGFVHERKAGRWIYYSLATASGTALLLATLRQLLDTDPSPLRRIARPAEPRGEAMTGTGDVGREHRTW